MPALVFLLLCSLSPSALAPKHASVQESGERPSLQELRRQLEERRERARAELEPKVNALLSELRAALPSGDPERLDSLQKKLSALPGEAAPLLIAALDPGESTTPLETRLASMIHLGLSEIGLRAVTPELSELARSGSSQGRALAISLLAQSTDLLDAGASLRSLWTAPPEGTGLLVANALLDLDGAKHAPVIAAALNEDSPDKIRWAVEALVTKSPPGAEAALSSLLNHPDNALPHIEGLLQFYRENSSAFGDGHATRFVELISIGSTPLEHDVSILHALPDLGRSLRSAWLDPLRDKEEASSERLLELIRICLARCGDRTARRNVLRDSEAWISGSKNSAEARMERGRILMALGDYTRAATDYEKAYELYKYPSTRRWQAGINEARAHIFGGHLRKASTVLKGLNLTPIVKREVILDPDFAELVEHPTYGRVLE